MSSRSSIAIARITGVDIRIDLSWLIGFGLILWSLGDLYLPNMYPALNRGDTWSLALGMATFFYVSIVAHELAHAWVSNRLKVPVKVITLFIFGGMAHMSREPRRARDEFFIASAGPALSLALAAAFGLLGRAGPETVGLKFAALGHWLGIANLWLFAFNLIPGFPLDGGRILRSLIWGVTGNYRRATQVAGFLGQAFGYGLMGWGIMRSLSGAWADGMWLVFIGWFLQSAAARATIQMTMLEELADVKAREVMVTDCPTLSPVTTLAQFMQQASLSGADQCFLVVGGGRVTGVITPREALAVPRQEWNATTVGRVMKLIGQFQAVPPEASVYEVLQQMGEEHVDRIPVIEEGQWLGMITRERILDRLRLGGRLHP